MRLIHSAHAYLVDPRVAVSNLDCYLVVVVLQRESYWLTAMTERVRYQLAPDQTLDFRRGVEVVLSGELSDKLTRRDAAVYVMRQWQGPEPGHNLDAFWSSDTQHEPLSFGGPICVLTTCTLPARG